MQVEVSKYTEGVVDKTLRPNGLPQSLIRYDARQKENALGSITEVVQTVKNPRSSAKSISQDAKQMDFMLPRLAETESIGTPSSQTPQWDPEGNLSRQDSDKKSRKSARVSLMGSKEGLPAVQGRPKANKFQSLKF
nr:putative LOV domain-containing protein [Ipomoea batatas]